MSDSTILQQVLGFIATHGKFLVTGHVRPDGDALGATVALVRMLRQQGKMADFAVDLDALGAPGFLIEGENALSFDQLAGHEYDAFICLDCGSEDRLDVRLLPYIQGKPALCIDHHRTNTSFAELNWVETHASSTGELIFCLAEAAGWEIDLQTAEALWVSLITDTGRFAYDMTSPRTLRVARTLVEKGVRTSQINDRLYCTFPRTAIELKKRAYASFQTALDGIVAYVVLTAQDFREVNGNKSDAEDVIEIPRSLAGVKVALFFYQTLDNPNVTRMSIRTRDPFDAADLALHFGGGGHTRAAGCDIPLPLDQAIDTVLKQIAARVSS